jgi:cellulose synthase/poly-beta-1,6-N-acetylglucosamine synthase-like glycosyltransferase
MMDRHPTLSVVIPTLGRSILIQTLESLSRTSGFETLDIIVAGNISDPNVSRRVEELQGRYSQIRHLKVAFPVGDSSEKKNAGCREARADIVAFIDDDVVVGKEWAVRILEPFSDPKVGLVSGPSLVPDDVPLMSRLAGVALASKAAGYVSERYLAGHDAIREVKWSRLIGCNMAYRRTVLEALGGFDPKFYPGEEMIAAFKATQTGHVLMFCPKATLHHYPRATFPRFWRQIYTYGATRIRLYRAGVELEWFPLIPALWVASLLLLVVTAPFCRVMATLLVLNLVLYCLVALWITIDKFRETRKMRDLLMVFLVPCMHFSYGWAEWVELFHRDRDFSDQQALGKGAAGTDDRPDRTL